jgi:hypothetical protein
MIVPQYRAEARIQERAPTVDLKAFAVQTLHDELSQAASSLPLA